MENIDNLPLAIDENLRQELEIAQQKEGEHQFLYRNGRQQAWMIAEASSMPAKIWYDDLQHRSMKSSPQVEDTIAHVFGEGNYEKFDYYDLIKKEILLATFTQAPEYHPKTLDEIKEELNHAKNDNAWEKLANEEEHLIEASEARKTHGLFADKHHEKEENLASVNQEAISRNKTTP